MCYAAIDNQDIQEDVTLSLISPDLSIAHISLEDTVEWSRIGLVIPESPGYKNINEQPNFHPILHDIY